MIRMNFKPTKKKIAISVVIIILWYVILFVFASLFHSSYYPCPSTFKASECPDVFVFKIIPGSYGFGCTCPEPTPLSEVFIQIMILLSPGILVYLVYSLNEKKTT